MPMPYTIFSFDDSSIAIVQDVLYRPPQPYCSLIFFGGHVRRRWLESGPSLPNRPMGHLFY